MRSTMREQYRHPMRARLKRYHVDQDRSCSSSKRFTAPGIGACLQRSDRARAQVSIPPPMLFPTGSHHPVTRTRLELLKSKQKIFPNRHEPNVRRMPSVSTDSEDADVGERRQPHEATSANKRVAGQESLGISAAKNSHSMCGSRTPRRHGSCQRATAQAGEEAF